MSAPTKLILVSKELAFATIAALGVDEQDSLLKSYVKADEAVKEKTGEYKEAAKCIGKVLCVIEERMERGKVARVVAPNATLKDTFKAITGAKTLPNHALTLKNTFGAYVRSGNAAIAITEADYDLNSNNCLELAGHILTDVKGDLNHPAVAQAAKELRERSDKEAKNLRAIREGLKPANGKDGANGIDAATAITMIEEITKAGHLGVALVHVPDLFAKMNEADQKSTFVTLAKTVAERLEAAVPPETVHKWMTEATATIEITRGETTAATEPAATEAAPELVAA